MVSKITTDCYDREKNTADIITKVQISQRSIVPILKKRGYKKVKPFWKPKLSLVIKTTCLVFAI